MNIDPAIFYKLIWAVGIMSAAIGALVTGVLQFLNGWRERAAANKRHLREIVMRGALENWKVVDQAAREANVERLPFTVFLVHMHKFSELLAKKTLTARDIEKNERESELVIAAAIRAAECATKRKQNRSNQAEN